MRTATVEHPSEPSTLEPQRSLSELTEDNARLREELEHRRRIEIFPELRSAVELLGGGVRAEREIRTRLRCLTDSRSEVERSAIAEALRARDVFVCGGKVRIVGEHRTDTVTLEGLEPLLRRLRELINSRQHRIARRELRAYIDSRPCSMMHISSGTLVSGLECEIEDALKCADAATVDEISDAVKAFDDVVLKRITPARGPVSDVFLSGRAPAIELLAQIVARGKLIGCEQTDVDLASLILEAPTWPHPPLTFRDLNVFPTGRSFAHRDRRLDDERRTLARDLGRWLDILSQWVTFKTKRIRKREVYEVVNEVRLSCSPIRMWQRYGEGFRVVARRKAV
jgi:hypothetical protein